MAVWGDFKSPDMIAKLKAALASWKKGKLSTPPWPKVDYEFKSTVNYVEKSDVNQSNIMLGHIGGLMNNPDLPALNIMNQILSFERMFKRVRTDEGLAYSVWGDYGATYVYPGRLQLRRPDEIPIDCLCRQHHAPGVEEDHRTRSDRRRAGQGQGRLPQLLCLQFRKQVPDRQPPYDRWPTTVTRWTSPKNRRPGSRR